MANPYAGINFWIYAPNRAAAIIFTVAFFISAAIHFWQCYRNKFFRVTGLFVAAGLLYVIGFAFRVNGAFGNWDQLGPFVVSVALIYVSPPLLSLVNYEILARVFYYVPYFSPMEPSTVLSTFAFLSIIIECINGVASSFIANPKSDPETGTSLMWAALALQLAIIMFFVVLAGSFHRRCVRAGIAGAEGIRRPLTTLYVSMGLILMRTIYRAVEHSVEAVANTEWPFYVFEALLMLVNMLMWNVFHPSRFLPVDPLTYLSRDGLTEITAEKVDDPQSFGVKMLSVLTLGAYRGPKSKGNMSQETDASGDAARPVELV
ncbi:RTA1 like protein-domain-containing protein [Daldinia sp. FL1419]|nr:RTA1 like protein-domain-containing protein [Daldinia sp. FL1419]